MTTKNELLLRKALSADTLLSAVRLGQITKLSQPTVSRTLTAMKQDIVITGRGRQTTYGLVAPCYGLPGSLPLGLVQEDGSIDLEWQLHHLHNGKIVVTHGSAWWQGDDRLPWPIAPIERSGYLGRLMAERKPYRSLLGTDITTWSNGAHVFAAATEGSDLPGAFIVGSPDPEDTTLVVPDDPVLRAQAYEKHITQSTGSFGSSAGGEQPKLLARTTSGVHFIVKYAPPHGTPFGVVWSDLLQAEAFALTLLAEAGSPTAITKKLVGERRTFLESKRFDRVGPRGRRHVIALDAIHAAFVPSPRQHWVATTSALAKEGRLSNDDVEQVRLWRSFGRLIANNDMHYGNLSLFVSNFHTGSFSLAPCYDMLPMAYRPSAHDEHTGPLPMTPPSAEPDERLIRPNAKRLAIKFWEGCADAVGSRQWKLTAAENATRIRALSD